MNRKEARDVARMVCEEVKGRPIEAIRALIDTREERIVHGPGGAEYLVTVEALPEPEDAGIIQILVTAETGGWSSLAPASWNDWIHIQSDSASGE